MCGSKVRLSITAETQHRLGRDYGGWPASRQTYALAPAGASLRFRDWFYMKRVPAGAFYRVPEEQQTDARETQCRKPHPNPAAVCFPSVPLPRSNLSFRNDRPRRLREIPNGRDRTAAGSLRRACPGIELRQGCSADRPWCRSILARGWYGSHHFQITPLHSEHAFSSRPRMRSVAAACQRKQFPHRGFRGQRSRPSVRPECKDDSWSLISSGCQSRSSQAPVRSYAPLDSQGRLSPRGHC